jgi:hypothetical protein
MVRDNLEMLFKFSSARPLEHFDAYCAIPLYALLVEKNDCTVFHKCRAQNGGQLGDDPL